MKDTNSVYDVVATVELEGRINELEKKMKDASSLVDSILGYELSCSMYNTLDKNEIKFLNDKLTEFKAFFKDIQTRDDFYRMKSLINNSYSSVLYSNDSLEIK